MVGPASWRAPCRWLWESSWFRSTTPGSRTTKGLRRYANSRLSSDVDHHHAPHGHVEPLDRERKPGLSAAGRSAAEPGGHDRSRGPRHRPHVEQPAEPDWIYWPVCAEGVQFDVRNLSIGLRHVAWEITDAPPQTRSEGRW